MLVRGLAFTPPILAGLLGGFVFVCALRLYPAIPGSAVQCGCLCLGSGFGCAPPFVVEVLGCARLCARSALTPPILARVFGRVCLFALGPYPRIRGSGVRCGCE